MKQVLCYFCGLFLLVAPLSGCGLKEIKQQTDVADQVGVIRGKVENKSGKEGDIVVVRFLDLDGVLAFQRKTMAAEDGSYEFPASVGSHYVAAYVDVNGDDFYQEGEPAAFYGKPTKINVVFLEEIELDPIEISTSEVSSLEELNLVDRRTKVWENIGQVASLDDPRFDSSFFGMGMWRPLDFLEQAEGGLFFLEEYNPDKIPVIFVHGIANGPTLWRDVLSNIDRERFQPWLFYYPSGLRLGMISDFLTEAVFQLQKQYDFEEFYAVAHSMGGLVTRSFVKQYTTRGTIEESRLKKVVTINSPMNGMASATSGVKYSPVIMPSWRDVDPQSTFIHKIHDWQWPEEIDYHLVVSFLEDQAGDGVVPLESQAQRELQQEAKRMYLFQSEHTELIGRSDFHDLLNTILEN